MEGKVLGQGLMSYGETLMEKRGWDDSRTGFLKSNNALKG